MASELRVNQITSQTGLGTVTFDNAGGVSFVNTTPTFNNISVNSINTGSIGGTKNRIINGDCRIDQRNSGSTIPSVGAGTTYVIDRWGVYSGLGGIFRAGQSLNNVSPPVGFSSYVGVQNISVSSSNINTLQQSIEGFNFADFDFGKSTAKPITLSFLMYSSVAGLHGGTFMNYAQTRIYPFSWNYTNVNTWQYVTITIPGDTSGTWVGSTNAGAATVVFCLGGGTSFFSGTPGVWISSAGGGTYGVTGQVNLANTSNATFYITGVQVEQGTIASAFERRSHGQELALAQRYYQEYIPTTQEWIYNEGNGSTGKWWQFQIRVPMRIAPNVTFSSGLTGGGIVGLTGTVSSLGAEGVSVNRVSVRVTMSGNTGTANLMYHCDTFANDPVYLNAEI